MNESPDGLDVTAYVNHTGMPTVAIDANGYWWRCWGEDPMWSMVPTNPDNSPIPQPVKFYQLVEVG